MLPFRFLLPLTMASLLALAAPARADNPFGVMLWPSNGEDTELLLARARGLGVAWYRPPAVFADHWSGACPSCSTYQRSGLNIALTVRHGGQGNGGRQASAPPPPADRAAYAKAVDSIAEAWKPALLVIEHEENNEQFYVDSDPAFHGYAQELQIACDAAHRRGLACTNGGLTGRAATLLAWSDVLGRDPAAACAFAGRAFPGEAAAFCAAGSPDALPDEPRRTLQVARTLLAIYKASPIDAVNFHWFADDARVLSEVAEALGRISGKPVLSNEIGQRRWEADSAKVRPLLRAAFAVPLRVAIWFSLDTPGSASLFEPDGRLRPTGWEFQRQMSGRR